MTYVLLVSIAKGGESLVGIIYGVGSGDGGTSDAIGDGFAFDKFHDHDQLIFESEGGAKRGDVGMTEGGEEADFPEEAIGEALLGGEVREKDFQGFGAVRDEIADFVDFAHTAGAQYGDDFVVADVLAGIEVGHGEPPANL